MSRRSGRNASENSSPHASPRHGFSPRNSPRVSRKSHQQHQSPYRQQQQQQQQQQQHSSSSPSDTPTYPPPPPPAPSASTSSNEFNQAGSADGTKTGGLDRVLLERNLERLLQERGTQSNDSSFELGRLMQARDREPLLCMPGSGSPSHSSSLPDIPSTLPLIGGGAAAAAATGGNLTTATTSPSTCVPESPATEEGAMALAASSLSSSSVSPCTPPEDKPSPPPPAPHEPPPQPHSSSRRVRFDVQGDDTLDEPSTSSGHRRHGRRSPPSPCLPRRHYVPRSKSLHSDEMPGCSSWSQTGARPRMDDEESCCSTCSSSSSSDDAEAYALPPRRAYGGVRLAYVPNDAMAIARRKAGAGGPSSPSNGSKEPDKCVVS